VVINLLPGLVHSNQVYDSGLMHNFLVPESIHPSLHFLMACPLHLIHSVRIKLYNLKWNLNKFFSKSMEGKLLLKEHLKQSKVSIQYLVLQKDPENWLKYTCPLITEGVSHIEYNWPNLDRHMFCKRRYTECICRYRPNKFNLDTHMTSNASLDYLYILDKFWYLNS